MSRGLLQKHDLGGGWNEARQRCSSILESVGRRRIALSPRGETKDFLTQGRTSRRMGRKPRARLLRLRRRAGVVVALPRERRYAGVRPTDFARPVRQNPSADMHTWANRI